MNGMRAKTTDVFTEVRLWGRYRRGHRCLFVHLCLDTTSGDTQEPTQSGPGHLMASPLVTTGLARVSRHCVPAYQQHDGGKDGLAVCMHDGGMSIGAGEGIYAQCSQSHVGEGGSDKPTCPAPRH